MSDLLLEVGTEEIPARLISGARRDLRLRFLEALRDTGLENGAKVSVEATPRRLALFADGMPSRQEDRIETLRGPHRRVAFDANGNPTRAGLGFARKVGVPVDELDTGADGKLMLKRRIAGRPARDMLAERLAQVVLAVRFPRSMYWAGKGSPRFIRPIRWVVALLDGEVVPFELAGVPAGSVTWGHRRLGAGPLAVSGARSYRSALRENGVILSSEERGLKILVEAREVLPHGCRLRHNWKLRETLVNETEFPTAVLGSFDSDYLSLPEEVLETVMLVHQKYFAVEDHGGAMTNRFVAVANSGGDEGGVIRKGHERVLRARFNDARFFWDFDQRVPLAARVDDLKAVTFQASLGSYSDKTERNVEAVAGLSKALDLDGRSARSAETAARLAKCDLTTEMVGEFPELQGKIGGLYAAAQGENSTVADAIYDHYLPLGSTAEIPRSDVGCVVSLADKLATLGGMFGLGLIPTGSKDPLALRRSAFGVIRIVVERRMPLALTRLVEIARAGRNHLALRSFLLERLRHWLQRHGGFDGDVIQAVIAASDEVPVDVLSRAIALDRVRSTPDFESLAVSFKRMRNILEHAGGAQAVGGQVLDPELMDTGAESELYEALQVVARRVAEYNATADYEASLREIAVLRPALDRYFDDVLVMTDDLAVRRNRLAFLTGMLAKLSTIADFAAIARDPTRSKAP